MRPFDSLIFGTFANHPLIIMALEDEENGVDNLKQVAVFAAAVKLPQFYPLAPQFWFVQRGHKVPSYHLCLTPRHRRQGHACSPAGG